MSVVGTSLSDLSLSGFFHSRRNCMTQNTDTANKANVNPAGTFNMRVGNTTYVVGVHFSQTSKDTLEDKVKRLITDDVKSAKF
ncbi:transposon-encoded TnpW family protein [Clostridioides difficile]|uniref:transposon-encoded TnpW family protein n=1 Tax=Clostridioides difficile TaxID=1496 RepID=UPI002E8E5E5B|nr:transposon-encoded TnpW family protein [Clostridioides difficile]